MATKNGGAGAQETANGEPQAAAPEGAKRPRKTAAARVATKTARAAKRQAKKSGKPVPAAATPAPAQKKGVGASGARVTSAAKRKAGSSAKDGILSRSVGKVRNAFSGAATKLSSLVRPKKPQG